MKTKYFSVLIFIYLASQTSSAFAFDCSRAKTSQEKAICADPETKRADDEMDAAFRALWPRLQNDQQKALQLSQRAFLQQRDRSCGDESDPKRAACLREKTEARLQFLEGGQSAGPGTGQHLQPRFIQSRGQKGQYDLYVDALEFPNPSTRGERKFNGETEKLLQAVPKPSTLYEPERRSVLTYDLSLRIAYASPQFLSAQIDIWDYSGGAHGNGGTQTINIDMERGVLLRFFDVFNDDAAAELRRDCAAQIERQKQEKVPDGSTWPSPEDIKKTIDETIIELNRWSFSAEGASVIFNPYEVGSYAEGQYECSFVASLLRPYLKFKFVLP